MGEFDGITVDGKSVEECIETEKSKDIRKTLESTLSSQIKILPKIGRIRFPETRERNSKVYNYSKAEIRRMNMKKTGVTALNKVMSVFLEFPNAWLSLKDFVVHTNGEIPKGTISSILSTIKKNKMHSFLYRVLQVPRKGYEFQYVGLSNIKVDELVKEHNAEILKKAQPKKPLLQKKDIIKEVVDNNSNLSAQYLIEFIEGLKRMGLKVDININITS